MVFLLDIFVLVIRLMNRCAFPTSIPRVMCRRFGNDPAAPIAKQCSSCIFDGSTAIQVPLSLKDVERRFWQLFVSRGDISTIFPMIAGAATPAANISHWYAWVQSSTGELVIFSGWTKPDIFWNIMIYHVLVCHPWTSIAYYCMLRDFFIDAFLGLLMSDARCCHSNSALGSRSCWKAISSCRSYCEPSHCNFRSLDETVARICRQLLLRTILVFYTFFE